MTPFDLIRQHSPQVALQFSGGRDSLALLLAMREVWDELTVYHLDTGDAFPETQGLIRRVEEVVPNFVRVQGDALRTRAEGGLPSDLVNVFSPWDQAFTDLNTTARVQSRYACCARAILLPLHNRMIEDGVTLILRGQRENDQVKSSIKDGATVAGVTVAFPLASWSTDQVETFLASTKMPLPPFYAEGAQAAPDCMGCTAWLEYNMLPYLRKHHPERWETVRRDLQTVQGEVARFSNLIEEQLNG